jgi:hypothetical protein
MQSQHVLEIHGFANVVLTASADANLLCPWDGAVAVSLCSISHHVAWTGLAAGGIDGCIHSACWTIVACTRICDVTPCCAHSCQARGHCSNSSNTAAVAAAEQRSIGR